MRLKLAPLAGALRDPANGARSEIAIGDSVKTYTVGLRCFCSSEDKRKRTALYTEILLCMAAMTTFVALDFETADQGRDSACAVGLVRVQDWEIVQRVHYLIRPPRSSIQFTSIHGIRWQDVADQPSFGELWNSIQPILGDVDFLAAHNAPFDQGVLHACCDAHGIPRPPQRFICTVQMARKTWNIRPTKLPNVCEFLGIPLEHHQALSDAEACAKIVIAAHQTQK